MIGAVMAKRRGASAFDALMQHNIEKAMAACAEDVTFTFPVKVRIGGETKGKKAVEAQFTKIIEQFPKMAFTVKEVFVSNIFAFGRTNNIAVEWEVDETDRNGKVFHNSGVTVFRAKGGKVVSIRDYISDHDSIKGAWGEA